MKEKLIDILTLALPESDKGSGQFLVSTICDQDRDAFESLERPHRQDYYSIYWVREGHLIHTLDGVSRDIKSHSLLLLAPGQVHQLIFKKRTTGFLIAFSDTFLCLKEAEQSSGWNNQLFFNCRFSSYIPFPRKESGDLEAVILLIQKEVDLKGEQYDAALQSLLKYLLVLASRAMEKIPSRSKIQEKVPHANLFYHFMHLIEQQFETLKNVSDYARLMHLHPVQLNEISKLLSGMTAGEHIRHRLLVEAKRYLHHTDLSSKEIAYKLGFDDPHYFSRFFKKYSGASPVKFRLMSQKEMTIHQ